MWIQCWKRSPVHPDESCSVVRLHGDKITRILRVVFSQPGRLFHFQLTDLQTLLSQSKLLETSVSGLQCITKATTKVGLKARRSFLEARRHHEHHFY